MNFLYFTYNFDKKHLSLVEKFNSLKTDEIILIGLSKIDKSSEGYKLFSKYFKIDDVIYEIKAKKRLCFYEKNQFSLDSYGFIGKIYEKTLYNIINVSKGNKDILKELQKIELETSKVFTNQLKEWHIQYGAAELLREKYKLAEFIFQHIDFLKNKKTFSHLDFILFTIISEFVLKLPAIPNKTNKNYFFIPTDEEINFLKCLMEQTPFEEFLYSELLLENSYIIVENLQDKEKKHKQLKACKSKKETKYGKIFCFKVDCIAKLIDKYEVIEIKTSISQKNHLNDKIKSALFQSITCASIFHLSKIHVSILLILPFLIPQYKRLDLSEIYINDPSEYSILIIEKIFKEIEKLRQIQMQIKVGAIPMP